MKRSEMISKIDEVLEKESIKSKYLNAELILSGIEKKGNKLKDFTINIEVNRINGSIAKVSIPLYDCWEEDNSERLH